MTLFLLWPEMVQFALSIWGRSICERRIMRRPRSFDRLLREIRPGSATSSSTTVSRSFSLVSWLPGATAFAPSVLQVLARFGYLRQLLLGYVVIDEPRTILRHRLLIILGQVEPKSLFLLSQAGVGGSLRCRGFSSSAEDAASTGTGRSSPGSYSPK